MNLKWAGVTPGQYETLRKTVNWEGNIPKGAIFHVSAFSEGGIHVTDVWETAEDFGNFAENRLKPGAAAANIAGEPTVDIFPVHATFAPGRDRL